MKTIRKRFKQSINWLILTFIAFAIYSLSLIANISIAQPLPSSSPNLSNNLITMSAPESESTNSTIQQLVERQANAWETADSEKIIADFAEDSIFIAPGFTFRSKQEIKEAAESYFKEFTDTKVTIKRIIADGNQGAVEWDWSEKNKKTSEISQAEDAIIFELEDGKIKYWREYIDKQPQGN